MDPVLEEIEKNLATLKIYQAGAYDALDYWTTSYLDFSSITNGVLSVMVAFEVVYEPLKNDHNIELNMDMFWYWLIYAFDGQSRVTEDWRKNTLQNY